TALRPLTPADSARGVALVAQIRAALLVYRDLQAARADGYRQFLPGVAQPVYHFTSRFNALREMFRFDPTKPTSLLYRKRADGSFELVGAMYADRAGASEDELNDRIPLALARWHEHVNWCVPPLRERERWTETKDGRPVFGPQSPIATPEACAAGGGRLGACPRADLGRDVAQPPRDADRGHGLRLVRGGRARAVRGARRGGAGALARRRGDAPGHALPRRRDLVPRRVGAGDLAEH